MNNPWGKRISRVFKNFLHSCLLVRNEFLDTTSLHGFHWLAESKRKLNGKPYNVLVMGLWLVTVITGVVFSLFLMNLVWKRFAVSPTITTIETNNYPISHVPFPGVTLCNINTVYKPNAEGIIKKLETYGVSAEKSQIFFKNLPALINYKDVTEEYLAIFDILVGIGYNASNLMLELAHPCKKMLKLCFWIGKPIPCGNFFRTTKTGFGYCCSFNYQALRRDLEIDIDIAEHYQINNPLIRTSGAGEDVSLRVVVDVEPHHYLAAKRFFYGTEIIIHDPGEFPEKSLLTAFGQPGTDVSIAIRVSVVDSVKEVTNLPVNLRFCRFGNEKRLQLTKKYSFHSCITECRAVTIIEICNCLPFFYPPIRRGNKTIRQCNLRDSGCLNRNKHVFSSLHTVQDKRTRNISKSGMSCDCLPSCSEQNYGADTFISSRVNGVGIPEMENPNFSSIVVYFKDLSCIKYRRELFKTWDDFLASFGGILGLCLGGSVISLVEILYFSTFKFFEIYADTEKSKSTLSKFQTRKRAMERSTKFQKQISKTKTTPIIFLQ